jgi:hypothetical protein
MISTLGPDKMTTPEVAHPQLRRRGKIKIRRVPDFWLFGHCEVASLRFGKSVFPLDNRGKFPEGKPACGKTGAKS